MQRNSLLNPVHPELTDSKNTGKLKYYHPLDKLKSQLETTAELLNINDGDYFIGAGDADTRTQTSQFLTGIQADIISLSNRVFAGMLFPKLIELITQRRYSGWGQGDDTSWELTHISSSSNSISNPAGCAEPSATFMLHRWWLSSDDTKEFCRLTITRITDDGQATARIEYLADDLKIVLQSQDVQINKYDDLSEWVAGYF